MLPVELDEDEDDAPAAAASALEADVVLVAASLGILFGPFAEAFTGDTGPAGTVAAPVPVFRIADAPAVDLVTRVGRASEAVMPRDAVTFDVLILFRAGGAASDGRTSVSSSSSESSARRLAAGVFRGCPGGAITFAFAVAAATCRLGVTGGRVVAT
jgi:hypothetical protein